MSETMKEANHDDVLLLRTLCKDLVMVAQEQAPGDVRTIINIAANALRDGADLLEDRLAEGILNGRRRENIA